ncbi:hypothetical protein Aperf_G00000089148 [Anoplocephala perfoliata]
MVLIEQARMFLDNITGQALLNFNDYILKEILSHTFKSAQQYQQNFTDIAKTSSTAKALICLFYAIIFVLSICGNSLVLLIITRKPEMHSVTNIFIINLAISDMLMTLVATPLTPAIIFVNGWSLNAPLCKLLPTVMGVTVYVSTLTSTAIAIERYIVIVSHILPRTRRVSFLGILPTWIISIICSLPLAIYQDVYFDELTNTTSCQEHWPQKCSRAVFTIVSFVLQFIIPSLIIAICYTRIGLVLQDRAKKRIGTKTRLKEETELKRKRQTIKMLIAMVMIFVACWIPLNCLWLFNDLEWVDFSESKYFTLIFFVCHICAMSSAVYNPFLYTWLNETFRNEFFHLMPNFIARLFNTKSPNKDLIFVIASPKLQLQDDITKRNRIHSQASIKSANDSHEEMQCLTASSAVQNGVN